MSWTKGKRVFQRLAGKEKCVVARVAIRLFFAVRMERSAGFVRWVYGGTLEGNEAQHEEGKELSGGLVVKFEVSGMCWIKLDDKASRKVDREGEPKAWCQ